MSNTVLPITTSSEYRNISLLLSALTCGAVLESPFRFQALSAFGLSYSVNPVAAERLLKSLKKKLLDINAQSELIADETEAVGFAAHVLIRQKKWDKELQQHQDKLISYFERVANLDWLRSNYVAMSFLLGFGGQKPFLKLAERAKAYLCDRLPDTNTSTLDFPVVIFGLYQAGASPQITDVQIRHWLDRTHQPFHYLCMLAVTLKAWQHTSAQIAITYLQERVSSVYAETVAQNVSLVGILLSAIRMAEMGLSGDEITQTLHRIQSDETTPDQISAVITAGSKLLVEFNLNLSAHVPLIEGLVFYLFVANQLGLTEAYIIDDRQKAQFLEFTKVQMRGQRFRAVGSVEFASLVVIAFIVGVTAIYRIWWPISSEIYDWILTSSKNQLLVEIVATHALDGVILVPIYFVLGSALTLWLHGQVKWSDAVMPDKVISNALVLIRSIFDRRST